MRIISLLTLILFAGSLALAAVPPELLTLGDLANHPDRCPPTVRMSSDVRFGDGVTLHQGQVVQVLDFNGSDLNVGTGTDARYTVGPNDCDLLAAANAAWARLSPRQRAVDAKAVLADASLWPERVKCFLAGTSNGRSIPTGTEYVLRAFDQTDGKVLWKVRLGSQVFGAAVTYSVNGRQYIAVAAGGGFNSTSPRIYPKIDQISGSNMVYVFALPEQ